MKPKSTEQSGVSSWGSISPCFRLLLLFHTPAHCSQVWHSVERAIFKDNRLYFARLYLCVGYKWFPGGSSPGLPRVVGSGFFGLLVCAAAAFHMPQQMWDWNQALLWRGLTQEGRLPAVPAHPAKGAGGPKASNFGIGQDAQSGAQSFMALALLYL